jgi:hypothetical protein
VSAATTIHANCVVIGETGVLIRGAAGSGKSTLARRLVAEAIRAGRFARLVADDRVALVRHGARLVARPHPAIAGRMELRGEDVIGVAHEPAAVIGLVVDLGVVGDRLPAPEAVNTELCGVRLGRMAAETAEQALDLVFSRLRPK